MAQAQASPIASTPLGETCILAVLSHGSASIYSLDFLFIIQQLGVLCSSSFRWSCSTVPSIVKGVAVWLTPHVLVVWVIFIEFLSFSWFWGGNHPFLSPHQLGISPVVIAIIILQQTKCGESVWHCMTLHFSPALPPIYLEPLNTVKQNYRMWELEFTLEIV